MKLGLMLGYSGAQLSLPIETIQRAEALGFHSVWTAEAYGSDATLPLAYIAALTKRIKLGTAVMQVAARTPALAAMQVATIDALAGGDRVIAGFGVSGPQIVEGWYGEPWGRPYHRIKDYVTIVRKILARNGPVSHDGPEIQLPYKGPGSMGIGKPLQSILHMNARIPLWLGTGTESNVKLTAEIADGWLPLSFVPGMMKTYRPWLDEGFQRAGGVKSLASFEIMPMCFAAITDDVRGVLRRMKDHTALYVGGMGHRNKNFHNDMMVRRGYGEAAKRIQELYLAGRKVEAAEAVPDEYLDEGALVGPRARIQERWADWRDSGATGLILNGSTPETMEFMAQLARK
jgi:F420-dependent oxidoreductase-like protein